MTEPEDRPEAPPVSGQTASPTATNVFDHVVPAKNPPALVSYYVAVFSLIPCLALILGPVAVYFGLKGLKAVKENPSLPGKGHAVFSVIFGSLMTMANVGAVCVAIFYSQFKS